MHSVVLLPTCAAGLPLTHWDCSPSDRTHARLARFRVVLRNLNVGGNVVLRVRDHYCVLLRGGIEGRTDACIVEVNAPILAPDVAEPVARNLA